MTTVTKYDLNIFVNNFFIINGIAPKHTITADVCADFAYNCYNTILSIPSDATAKQRLYNYVLSMANYYGVPVAKFASYAKRFELEKFFLQYIKDNYTIQGNGEIIKDLVADAFGYVSSAVANALWALIKPLLPLVALGFGAIYLFNRVSTTQKR